MLSWISYFLQGTDLPLLLTHPVAEAPVPTAAAPELATPELAAPELATPETTGAEYPVATTPPVYPPETPPRRPPLGSHSSHDVNYMNIYQNTNHPHLYDCNLEGSPRHSLGSNNSSNLSTPPSPVREMGSSSYESWKYKVLCWHRRSQHIASRSLPAGEKRDIWTKKGDGGQSETTRDSERGVPLLSDCEAFIFKFNFV